MDIQAIISVLSLLGIGGVVGSYLQYFLNQRGETELRIQSLNENQYRSTLIFMRCVLKPENVDQFHIEDPNIKHLKNNEEIEKYAIEHNLFIYEVILLSWENFKTNLNKKGEQNGKAS